MTGFFATLFARLFIKFSPALFTRLFTTVRAIPRATLMFMAMLTPLTFALAAPVQAQQAPFTLLFLGDSLTEGYGLEDGESFPSLIAARFKAEGRDDIKVINGGVSGSTSASAPGRLQWYARSKPDLMLLALGANDGLRGLDVEEMKANLIKTIEFAQANGIAVALAGMLIPPNYGADYTQAFADVFPALAQRYHLPFMPFLLQDVAAMPELNQADGIHPNAQGARIVADNVWNFLQPLLPSS